MPNGKSRGRVYNAAMGFSDYILWVAVALFSAGSFTFGAISIARELMRQSDARWIEVYKDYSTLIKTFVGFSSQLLIVEDRLDDIIRRLERFEQSLK